ncbi:MAG: M48 family metalloprotease, partial [gamma proteobacterium symbiont of Bathyaustriella thionipta]|nr:M48 family metalloprotease [gamma proteobacterium symbiont of Bathyaustriella thionipta]
VYSVLFLTTDTESELAYVLGHEIAHVTQRHLARSFEKANQLSLPIMAGMIAGILLGAAGGDSSLGAATALGLSAAGQQAQINYTRANEKEADRVGMRYLSRSGYDPSGMHGFFQKLERKNRYVGNYPEFLRTHPITINRIAEATQRAEQYKRAMKRFKSPLTYRLMKAKLTVLTAANTEQVVHYYQEKVEKNDQTIHPEYYFGYGLALSKKRAYNQSIELFKELHNSSPENISYVIALANAYIASGKKSAIQTGLKLLADTFKNKSYNLVLTADYANALMQTGQIKKSIHLLENYNKDNFKHPSIYKLLSIALGKNKELVKAHIAESNYYYLKGMLSAAIEQLKIAKKITPKNDFYTLSKLDSQKQAHLEEKQLYTLDE